MQSSRTDRNHYIRGIDPNGALTLAVVVCQFTAKRGEAVGNTEGSVRPGIRRRVFEVEHHARRSRVQHLDHEFGVVGGAGHLVALIPAPIRQFDTPRFGGCWGRRQVAWQMALVGCSETGSTPFDELALMRSKSTMQRQQKLDKTLGEVP